MESLRGAGYWNCGNEEIVSFPSAGSAMAHGSRGKIIRPFCQDSRGRATALMILGLLCFQLSRVYLVIPVDAFICSEAGDTHGAASLSSHGHDHEYGEAVEATLSQSNDGRNYIRHCKDTLDGLGLIPAQPFGLPAAISPQKLEANWVNLPRQADSALENYLPPLLQPPKDLS